MTLRAEIGNIDTLLIPETGSDHKALIKLNKSLIVKAPGAEYTWKYKSGDWDGNVRFLGECAEGYKCPTGFTPTAIDLLRQNSSSTTICDTRRIPQITLKNTTVPLRDYQWQAASSVFRNVWSGLYWPRGVIRMATGGGKCLGKGTPVILFNGEIKKVEDICPGDLLMGPDSNPRVVKSTSKGVGPLYKIDPVKGKSWICNDAHILTLVNTISNEIVDISVNDYLNKNKTWKHQFKQFSVGVEFNKKELPVDPYFIGVWLGDGRKDLSQGIQISKPDPEIQTLCSNIADDWGLELRIDRYENRCPTYRIVAQRGKHNSLLYVMRHLNLDLYKTSSFKQRASLLAGLLDTDGYRHRSGYEIVQKSQEIAELIVFVARSLGLRALKNIKTVPGYGDYYRISISGDCTFLPLRIPRKLPLARKQKKNVLRTGFSITPIREGEYFGFTLDGDGRFLLGDFTVTHNTETAAAMIEMVDRPTLFLVHRKDLLHQAHERFVKYGLDSDRFGDGFLLSSSKSSSRVLVCTVQTLSNHIEEPKVQAFLADREMVIVDEAHSIAASLDKGNQFSQVLKYMPNAFIRIGLTATPFLRDRYSNQLLEGATGKILIDINARYLIDRGFLSEAKIKMIQMPALPPGCFKPPPGKKTSRFQMAYSAAIETLDKRNERILDEIQKLPGPNLILVKTIAHGNILVQRASNRGIDLPFISGKNSRAERKAAIDKLVKTNGSLMTTGIFDEGIDIPALRGLILAAGGKSEGRSLQRLGRGLRKWAGKKGLKVVDFYDLSQPLRAHSEGRKKLWMSEGYDVDVVT